MSVSTDVACVYRGEVMHQRLRDTAYRFRYRVFSLLLDIDRIDEAARSTWLFSRNRFNVLSFYDRDHLPDGDGDGDLRAWANAVLADHGLRGEGLRIRLLCFPRMMGWVFNPLSLWYCEDPNGRPVAVIAEVRNTFGERHCYLLRAAPDAGWPVRDEHDKDFHVSPFIAMRARYIFRLSRPDERLRIVIREFRDDELLLVATQTGSRRAFSAAVLYRELARVPLQTLKVLGAIHWHALKLWRSGLQFHRKPQPPYEEVS